MKSLLPLLLLLVAVPSWADYRDFGQLLPKGSTFNLVLMSPEGQVEYSHGGDLLVPPASTTKLLTATAAWLSLGPEFRFHTQFLGTKPVNGVLADDLVLRMSGDPTLSRSDLYRLLQQLQALGVTRIRGDLLLDGSQFQGYTMAQGWPWDDLGICFAAASSALMLDSGCAKARLQRREQSYRLELAPWLPIALSHQITLAPPSPYCPLELTHGGENRYQLRGCFDKDLPLAIAIADPEAYLTAVLTQQLAELGIRLDGTIRAVTEPRQAPLLVEHRSVALDKLLRRVLADSNNQISDSLFRHIALAEGKPDSGFQASAIAVKQVLLRELALPLGNVALYDGSGLSRYNLIRAQDLAQLLRHWHQDERLAPLLPLLPTAGQDGTLRRRAGLAPVTGQYRGKSGTFAQVRNLAGVVTRADGSELIVVQMVSGIAEDNDTNRRMLTEFEQALYRCVQQSCFADDAKERI
ncbi:D-alanyl-D-alanine carboxypeptidase/D-alanyl-D-alanine endopeptidase [Ferrimonas marina]|uniref:D-alanyl-D-alanine carboxypeptidase / D-alanyl-D-alanine-endopeptidase (Penicillin-binding protein 4) n=1 Tax=Ferrimonas marina TaxID=299255 RepID=A0A1M5NB41_9GAMM|nr:D-alanyl-D-alanine carboxypeptidase/D-alanyl-D-alanine-endopeptidase [Ferrimonas marina]SHG86717.1 D-alanyl-D-alanine carboxypeptidase / D-alanyl-D-alanine-endopeptidase (penicillin-binding protein 4) [Ferrimonas marina]